MDTKFLKPPVNEDSKQVLSDMDQQKWISETMDPSFNQPCAVVLVTTIHQPKTVTRMRMIYTPTNQATWGCMVWFGWLYSFIYCHLLLCRSQDQFLVCDLSPVLYIYIYTLPFIHWIDLLRWFDNAWMVHLHFSAPGAVVLSHPCLSRHGLLLPWLCVTWRDKRYSRTRHSPILVERKQGIIHRFSRKTPHTAENWHGTWKYLLDKEKHYQTTSFWVPC